MNPYSGDIEQFPLAKELLEKIPLQQSSFLPQSSPSPEPPSRQGVPEGWLSLTAEEEAEFETLPKMMRIERYIKYHRTDKCANCGCFVGNHHPKKFIECAATELARIDCLRLEKEEVHA